MKAEGQPITSGSLPYGATAPSHRGLPDAAPAAWTATARAPCAVRRPAATITAVRLGYLSAVGEGRGWWVQALLLAGTHSRPTPWPRPHLRQSTARTVPRRQNRRPLRREAGCQLGAPRARARARSTLLQQNSFRDHFLQRGVHALRRTIAVAPVAPAACSPLPPPPWRRAARASPCPQARGGRRRLLHGSTRGRPVAPPRACTTA